MGWGGEKRYEEERLVLHWCLWQKQVETMLQKSSRPRLTGKKTLLSRQNGEDEERDVCYFQNDFEDFYWTSSL